MIQLVEVKKESFSTDLKNQLNDFGLKEDRIKGRVLRESLQKGIWFVFVDFGKLGMHIFERDKLEYILDTTRPELSSKEIKQLRL
jgi:hypothetical protein